MKKILLTSIILATLLGPSCAQTEWTSFKPMYGHGTTYWYDDGWTGHTRFQKGSTWAFAGEVPDTDNIDSIYCSIVILTYFGFGFYPLEIVDSTLYNGDYLDGKYSGVLLTIAEDWPSCEWNKDFEDRPILQTRIGYDTNIYPFGVPPKPNGGPGDCYHNLIGGVCDAYTDTLSITNHTFTPTGDPNGVPFANVELQTEIIAGIDTINVQGFYGVGNLNALTIGIYHTNASNTIINADIDTIATPGGQRENSGYFDYNFIIDAEFAATNQTIAEDEDLVVKLIADYDGDVTEEIWLHTDIVECYTPDSIKIMLSDDSGYIDSADTYLEIFPEYDFFTAKVEPANSCTGIRWYLADSTLIEVNQDGEILHPLLSKTLYCELANTWLYAASLADSSVKDSVYITSACFGVGLNEYDSQLDYIKLFPNPAQNKINIKGVRHGEYTVAVYSMMGSLMLEHDIDFNKEHAVNIDHLPAGSYIMHIKGKQGHKLLHFSKL